MQGRIRNFGFFKRLIFVETAALLTALSMPGMFLNLFVWIGLVGMFFALEGTSWWKSALYGWIFGITFLAIGMYWLLPTLTSNISAFDGFPPWLGTMAFLLFLIIEGAFWALFGFLYSLISMNSSPRLLKALAVAGAYTLTEYLRGIGELGFTGMRLSSALYRQLGFIQLSSFFGTLGLIFVVSLINYAFYVALKKKSPGAFFFGAFVVVAAYLSAFIVPKNSLKVPISVGVVQPNVTVAQRYRMSDDEILAQMENALSQLKGKTNLVIFPEGTFEYSPSESTFKKMAKVLGEYNMSAIVGFPRFLHSKIYNSVGLFTSKGLDSTYSKHILVPFTETLPYPRFFGLFKFLKLSSFFSPGKKYTVFDWNGKKFAVQICFESYFGRLSRRFVNDGAQFLVTVTNDSWFSQKTALEQHFSQSVFRAVENKKWTIQVADTGITGVVNPNGRIIKTLKIHKREVAVFEIGANDFKTFYDRCGDWFAWIALFFVVWDMVYLFKERS